MDDLGDAAAGALSAEIGWRGADGHLDMTARMPLVRGSEPVLALTYDDLALARCLAAATDAVLVLSDARFALHGWQPLQVPVTMSLRHDPEGEVFVEELVDQELRKFPPSRLRADSLLQRRENWWYLARVLVTLHPLRRVEAITARATEDSAVVCWGTRGLLRATTASVRDWNQDRILLRRLDLGTFDDASGAPAAALRHEATVDRERSATAVAAGRLDGWALTVSSRRGDPRLPAAPGVWQRIRHARRLERACRRGLADAGF